MGFSLAVAVLLDAVIIRIMILPALMLLLGDRTWWPSRSVARAQPTGSATPEVRPLENVG